jgi:NAD(P)-dependent dehydrogenase (short-subunit alcohol dehydrogenase family)
MHSHPKPEVVVVTGASAGLGRAIAREFGKRAAHVGLLARGIDGLWAAEREIESLGGQAVALPTDVADAQRVEQAAAAVEERFGPIDIWINNAMVSVFAPVMQTTADEYRRVAEVTYLGYVHGTQSALRRMLPRDRGMIVQVGSALAYRAIPLQSAYCAAKHAIQGFTESLRSELLHDGSQVQVCMVHMPALNTPQFRWVRSRLPRKAQPVPPIYQPEVGARAVYHAAHHYRREWNVGLTTDIAVFGNKLAPGVGDYYLARTGFESQMTDEPADPNRPDNLDQPLPGDHGAHGVFDDRSKPSSWQFWLNKHRGGLAMAAVGAASLALWAASRTNGQNGRARRLSGSMSHRAE